VEFPTDDGTGRTAAVVVPPGAKPGDKLKALVPPSPLKDTSNAAGPAANPSGGTAAATSIGGDSTSRTLFDSDRGWSEAWGNTSSSSSHATPRAPSPARPANDPFAAPAAVPGGPVDTATPSSSFSSGISQFDSGRSSSNNDFSTLPPAEVNDPFASQGSQPLSPQAPPVPPPTASAPAVASNNDPFGGLDYNASSGSGSTQGHWAHTRMSMQAAAALASLGSPGAVNRGPHQQTAQQAPASDPFKDFGQVK